jgi:hypothetical protein
MPALKNAKWEAVLQQFVASEDRVGWRAYCAVYKGSSQRAAETAWSRLLKSAVFVTRRDELLAEIAEAVKSAKVMDLQETLEGLTNIGRANIKNVLVDGDSEHDVVASIRDLPDEHAATIKSLTIDTFMTGKGDDAREVKRVKVELHNKLGALHELRAHHEPQRHELMGKGGGPIEHKGTGEPMSELDFARRIAFALEQGARQAAKQQAKVAAAPAAPKRKVKTK